MTKRPTISVRVSPEVKEALEAEAERREVPLAVVVEERLTVGLTSARLVRRRMVRQLAEAVLHAENFLSAYKAIEARYLAGADDPAAFGELEETALRAGADLHSSLEGAFAGPQSVKSLAAGAEAMPQGPDVRERLGEIREKIDAFEAEEVDLSEREKAFRVAELRLLHGRLYRQREPLIEIKRLQGFTGDALDAERQLIEQADEKMLVDMYDAMLLVVREKLEREPWAAQTDVVKGTRGHTDDA